MADPQSMARALQGGGKKPQSNAPVGLADNSASGEPFQCGTCEYFDAGVCHHDNPKLNGRQVQPTWCCNLYDHDGMKHILD